MRIKDGIILTSLGDSFVAVSTDDSSNSKMMIKMNKTSADVWRYIEGGFDEKEIAAKLVEKYDGVDYEHALQNTLYIIDVLKQKDILID